MSAVCGFEGIGHPKIQICHHLLIPSLYEFLSSVEHKRRSSEDCVDCFFFFTRRYKVLIRERQFTQRPYLQCLHDFNNS